MPFVRKWRGVVSLLDMLRFYAQSFVFSSSTLMQVAHILERGEGLRDSHIAPLGAALGELQRECERVELPMTTKQIQRMRRAIDDGSFKKLAEIRQQLQELLRIT